MYCVVTDDDASKTKSCLAAIVLKCHSVNNLSKHMTSVCVRCKWHFTRAFMQTKQSWKFARLSRFVSDACHSTQQLECTHQWVRQSYSHILCNAPWCNHCDCFSNMPRNRTVTFDFASESRTENRRRKKFRGAINCNFIYLLSGWNRWQNKYCVDSIFVRWCFDTRRAPMNSMHRRAKEQIGAHAVCATINWIQCHEQICNICENFHCFCLRSDLCANLLHVRAVQLISSFVQLNGI